MKKTVKPPDKQNDLRNSYDEKRKKLGHILLDIGFRLLKYLAISLFLILSSLILEIAISHCLGSFPWVAHYADLLRLGILFAFGGFWFIDSFLALWKHWRD